MISWWLANRSTRSTSSGRAARSPRSSRSSRADRDVLPSAAPFDGIWEEIDRLIENKARRFGPLWEEMKTNARAASGPISQPAARSTGAVANPGPDPGVTLLIEQLRQYATGHPGQVQLPPRRPQRRFGRARRGAAPAREPRAVRRVDAADGWRDPGRGVRADRPAPLERAGWTVRDLRPDRRRRDADQCPGPPVTLYHKSLLYLVARSLERDGPYGGTRAGTRSPRSRWSACPSTSDDPQASATARPGRSVDLIGGQGSTVIGPNHEPAAARPLRRAPATESSTTTRTR